MRNWLLATWDTLRTGIWPIPLFMILLGVGLAAFMLQLDSTTGAEGGIRAWWINGGSGEDARNLLSTLLGATIAMASMAFSVTVVALTLAANNYGPRLIRIFRADRRTQFVLGIFVMTIVYCLVVLRSIHGAAPVAQVPHASVTVGTALSFAAVLALLGFIQGVARSIAADEVVRRVRRELDDAVSDLPKLDAGYSSAPPTRDLPSDLELNSARIPLPREGYVQAVDYDRMVAWAERSGSILRLEFGAGDFVVDGDQRLVIYPRPADPSRARAEIDRFIVSGNERTPTQDLEFALRHLIEMALRALSPGINDPYTAKAVIDRLQGAMSRLAGRRLPPPVIADSAGQPRVIRPAVDYGRLLDAAFHQIRQAASDKPSVLIHVLEAITGVAGHTRLDEQRRELVRHADLIRDAARRDVAEPADVRDVEQGHAKALAVIAAAASPPADLPG